MNRIFSSRRRFVAVALTAVIIAGAAGTAAAYFSASGSGSSTAYVGAAATFTVTVGTETPPGTYLLPDSTVGGPNIEHFAYSVTNNSAGNVFLNHVTISLTGLPLNCQANWFSIDGTSPSGTNTQNPATTLGGGATYDGSTTVELIDSGTPQDACVGATPTVNVQATSS